MLFYLGRYKILVKHKKIPEPEVPATVLARLEDVASLAGLQLNELEVCAWRLTCVRPRRLACLNARLYPWCVRSGRWLPWYCGAVE